MQQKNSKLINNSSLFIDAILKKRFNVGFRHIKSKNTNLNMKNILILSCCAQKLDNWFLLSFGDETVQVV